MHSLILSLSVLAAPALLAQGPDCNSPEAISGIGVDWDWGVNGGTTGLPAGPCDFLAGIPDGHYLWTAPADGHYRLASYSDTAYARIHAYAGAGCGGTLLGCHQHGHAPDNVQIALGVLAAGDPVLIRGGGTYTGSFRIEYLGSDCTGVVEDSFAPNHFCSASKPIGNGAFSALALMPGAEIDWFSLCVDAGETLQVSLANAKNLPQTFNITLREVDPNGTGCGTLPGGVNIWEAGLAPALTYLNTTGATQYFDFRVVGAFGGGCASYDLDISGTNNCGVGPETTTFCDPMLPNSTGQPTNLDAVTGTGVASGVRLEASQGPPGQFASFIIGDSTFEPGLPLGQGLFCLGQGPGQFFGRYNIANSNMNSIGQFDAQGDFQNLVGTSQTGTGFDVPLTIPTAGGMIQAGQTWHFQMWLRDSGGQSNWSNGVSVTF